LDFSRRKKILCVDSLLTEALSDADEYATTSIWGIEHFVYPELQQEMIRKKKEVQSQVMSFVKSKRPDPQGWRLANHSRMYSQWARDVALDKGRAYRMIKEEDGLKKNNDKTTEFHRSNSTRRKNRRASMSLCESMPSVGSGAATASLVRMEFFDSVKEETKRELFESAFPKEEQRREDTVPIASCDNEEYGCIAEWREEFDEA
jgi:hypothetical protein